MPAVVREGEAAGVGGRRNQLPQPPRVDALAVPRQFARLVVPPERALGQLAHGPAERIPIVAPLADLAPVVREDVGLSIAPGLVEGAGGRAAASAGDARRDAPELAVAAAQVEASAEAFSDG